MLPKDLPPYGIVNYYFRQWQQSGLWKKINLFLVRNWRQKKKRKPSPSVGIIDSQSVKNREWGLPDKGFDGNKKINGRKRHLVIDSLGHILTVLVGPANEHDSKAGKILLKRLYNCRFRRMETIIGDGAYKYLGEYLSHYFKWILQIIKLDDFFKGTFKVLPQRWKVERTISWTMWFRRLSFDYEAYPQTSETFVLLANIQIILKKL